MQMKVQDQNTKEKEELLARLGVAETSYKAAIELRDWESAKALAEHKAHLLSRLALCDKQSAAGGA